MAKWAIEPQGFGVKNVVSYDNNERFVCGSVDEDVPEGDIVEWIIREGNGQIGDTITLDGQVCQFHESWEKGV